MKHQAVCGTYPKYNTGCRCRDCTRAHAENVRQWNRNNTERVRCINRTKNLKQYGLSVADYERLYVAQDRVCALCQQTCRTGKHLAVDHDHKTGQVRGLLCYSCNVKLGWYETMAAQINDYLLQASGVAA